MNVRFPESWEDDLSEKDRGKVLLFIESDYHHDAALTVSELIELRCEIDKFLLKLAVGKSASEPK